MDQFKIGSKEKRGAQRNRPEPRCQLLEQVFV
jgi:hypothetical protein